MYNEELKMSFIKQYSIKINTIKTCVGLFDSTEKFESEWGADLCTRSEKELKPMLESVIGFRTYNKNARYIILREYVKWCLANDVPDACDAMLSVKPSGVKKIKQRMVANPQGLQKYLDILFSPESSETIDNTSRCYFWMAYAGIPEEDILEVKCSEVDFETMTIHHGGRDYIMYRESLPAFKNCANLPSFAFEHPNYQQPIRRNRVAGDTIMRGIKTNPGIQRVRIVISRKANEYEEKASGRRLSYFRAWISGVFYRAYQDELCGEEVDFNSIAATQMEGKQYKLDSGRNTMDAKRRQLARDYYENYLRWKLAFGMN